MATLKYKDPESGEVKRVWAPTGDKVDVSGPISEHNASETAHEDIRAAVSEAESNAKAYIDEKLADIDIPDGGTSDSVLEQNNGEEQKFWVGTKAEFDAVETKDDNTMYVVTDEDAGEDIEEHNVDPEAHADIRMLIDGKAPAGFGLGEDYEAARLADPDNPPGIGWFYLSSTTTGGDTSKLPNPTFYGNVRVDNISYDADGNSASGLETAYYLGNNHGAVYQRYQTGANTWTDWEWVNPPMVLNEEYRTTERINGLAVYKKKTDSGIQYRLDGETEWKPYADAVGGTYTSSGTWTPTLVDGAKSAEFSGTPQYFKNGNIVTISGFIYITLSEPSDSVLTISLPFRNIALRMYGNVGYNTLGKSNPYINSGEANRYFCVGYGNTGSGENLIKGSDIGTATKILQFSMTYPTDE